LPVTAAGATNAAAADARLALVVPRLSQAGQEYLRRRAEERSQRHIDTVARTAAAGARPAPVVAGLTRADEEYLQRVAQERDQRRLDAMVRAAQRARLAHDEVQEPASSEIHPPDEVQEPASSEIHPPNEVQEPASPEIDTPDEAQELASPEIHPPESRACPGAPLRPPTAGRLADVPGDTAVVPRVLFPPPVQSAVHPMRPAKRPANDQVIDQDEDQAANSAVGGNGMRKRRRLNLRGSSGPRTLRLTLFDRGNHQVGVHTVTVHPGQSINGALLLAGGPTLHAAQIGMEACNPNASLEELDLGDAAATVSIDGWILPQLQGAAEGDVTERVDGSDAGDDGMDGVDDD